MYWDLNEVSIERKQKLVDNFKDTTVTAVIPLERGGVACL